jgi:DNA processing protein
MAAAPAPRSSVGTCDSCLRRAALLGLLAPYIARSLDEHRKLPALLALTDQDLIDATAGRKRHHVLDRHARFDAGAARRAAARAELAMACVHDDAFPSALLDAPDAPALLYLRGDPAVIERLTADPAVAIVGSRRATPYGIEAAHALARELSACGVPVVSGMALGVDSAAHHGALEGEAPTVAVLACGADVPYPRGKRRLYERIVAQGLVVSELPPGSPAFRWCFPARNRIMAGLAAMTVVVEGTDRSGSLITAAFAADLGRDVGAVPGQITSALASGPNALLADGACVVRSAADILDIVHGVGEGRRVLERGRVERLEPRLQALLASVEQGEGTADAIAHDPAEVADVLAGLSELEIMGLIRRAAGGRYLRCA